MASENQLNDYIESGSAASDAAWPWRAALLRDGQFLCSATVVSTRWLLTSPRCLMYVMPCLHGVERLTSQLVQILKFISVPQLSVSHLLACNLNFYFDLNTVFLSVIYFVLA